jgi:hypothetical protein
VNGGFEQDLGAEIVPEAGHETLVQQQGAQLTTPKPPVLETFCEHIHRR